MATFPPDTPPPGTPASAERSTRPAQWAAGGLIAGILAGLMLGYLVFKGSAHPRPVAAVTPVASPTATPSVSASESASASPSATSAPATAAPTAAPATPTAAPATPAPAPGAVPGQLTDASFSGCPAMAAGQHPLAAITGPTASGATANSANEWYGCGNVVTPGGTPGMTGSNWELAYSFSCPDADAPSAPAVPGMTIESWVYAGGGTPVQNAANTATAYLPWSDDSHSNAPAAGDYRLRTRLANNAIGDNRCRWHIAAYTTPP